MNIKKGVEKMKQHWVVFLGSIALTIISFALVRSADINETFMYLMLVGCALIQAVLQLAVWMHMRERGHSFAIVGISFAFVVVLTMVAMAQWLVWW
jgi:cytochrome c oxidase subunit 4